MNPHESLSIIPIVHDDRWKTPDLSGIISSVTQVLPPQDYGEVSLVFSNDQEVQNLNHRFRSKNKPTNVLSFPMNEHGLLGDIILSYDTCLKESLEQSKSFGHHTIHLIVHGILHLLGYDHETDEDADEMESLEIEILHNLGIPNPYLNLEEV